MILRYAFENAKFCDKKYVVYMQAWGYDSTYNVYEQIDGKNRAHMEMQESQYKSFEKRLLDLGWHKQEDQNLTKILD